MVCDTVALGYYLCGREDGTETAYLELAGFVGETGAEFVDTGLTDGIDAL